MIVMKEQRELEKWEREERSVTLTRSQWSMLTTYLVMSSGYRNKELENWEFFVGVKNSDGSPLFPHASDNVVFWRRMIDEIDVIKYKIDNF